MATGGGMERQAVPVFEPTNSKRSELEERFVSALRSQSNLQSPPRSRPTAASRDPSKRPILHQSRSERRSGLIELQRYDPRYPNLLLQPDSRPISQEQLASEVKSIYAGLTMVETKCIHVDHAEAAAAADPSRSKLPSDHWQALIALHRTLLHEHHDFFLASQHPSASPALRRLAAKYSMPARMWKHGIHSFLELLRQRLPDPTDYMLAFIYLAYQMMALLYETVPAFDDTWIECLGDLGRYRMAIEDEGVRDRETWAGVARSWYTKAADKNPTVGRIYHHLAILARPSALQQLYYYSRSLTCVKPFPSAREFILTLLDPVIGRAVKGYSHALPIDANYIKAHALLFEQKILEDQGRAMDEFTSQLDNHIGRVTAKWKKQGVYITVTNISGWFDYGPDDGLLRQILESSLTSQETEFTEGDSSHACPDSDSTSRLSQVLTLTTSTLGMVGRRMQKILVPRDFHTLRTFVTTFSSPMITLMTVLPLLPTTAAYPLAQTPAPFAEEKSSTFSDGSIGDWVVSGVILAYLVLAYWLDPQTRKLSLAGSVISATFWVAMISEGDRPDFPENYRWNILKTWAATTVALTCQTIKSSIEIANRGAPAPLNASCSEAITHRFLFQLFPTFALIQVTGMTIQSFGSGSFLNAVPPCLSIAVIITSRLNQRANQHPRVAADVTSNDTTRADTSRQSDLTSISPRQSANASLPNPSHFALTEDETDLDSLTGT